MDVWSNCRTGCGSHARAVFPAEPIYQDHLDSNDDPHVVPPVLDELKVEARSRGLWNLFLPDVSGLTNLEYASLAEIRLLLGTLGLDTIDGVVEVVERYFPDEPLSDRSRLLIEDLLAERD